MIDQKLQELIQEGVLILEERRAEQEAERRRKEKEEQDEQEHRWKKIMEATPEAIRPYAQRIKVEYHNQRRPVSVRVSFRIPAAIELQGVYDYLEANDTVFVTCWDVIRDRSDYTRFQADDVAAAVATAILEGMKKEVPNE